MPERENYLSDGDVRYQKGINRRVKGGKGSQRQRVRRRRGPGPFMGRVVLAQVNVPGGVTSGTGTFAFDNATRVVGNPPPDGTGLAQNNYSQTFTDNERILLFYDYPNDEWVTERGGSAGSQLFRFETTAAKDWDASTVAGVLLDATDTPVGGSITLTDRAPAKHQALEGSRGYCLLDGEDTYWILTMDSPARWVEATLAEEWTLGSLFGRCEIDDYWGAAPNHMEPETEEYNFGGGETGNPDDIRDIIKVYDSVKVQHRTMASGEKIRALWDEKRKKWYLQTCPLYLRIKGPSPGITRDDTDFTLSTYTVLNGVAPVGDVKVECIVPMNAPAGRTVYAVFNTDAGSGPVNEMWDNGDGGNFIFHLRGLSPDYQPETIVESGDTDADDPHWAETSDCDPPPE